MPTLTFILLALLPSVSLAANTNYKPTNLDSIWLIIAAALVFFMQAGFTALESGMIRAKNSINVAIKNACDMLVTILAFWSV